MLLQLNICNFALIEKLTINFEKGFNVFLGETGAGKSILIDAIQYVIGGKFEKDLIRIGEKKTYVEGIFSIENSKTKEILDEMNIEYEDQILIISRETFQSGKNIAKVNGKSLLLSQLKIITSTLIDIHGQHKNQNLLNSSNYIDFIDTFGNDKIYSIIQKYKTKYDKLKFIEKKIEELSGKNGEKEKVIDFLKYQIDEIEKANLNINEDIELEEKHKKLSNYEKINKALTSSYNLLHYGDNSNSSVCDALNVVLKNLRDIEDTSNDVAKMADTIEEIYYNVQDITDNIRNLGEDAYYDENELEQINNRIYEIDNYKRKYGKTIKDILQYKDEITHKYNEMINSKEIINKLHKEKNEVSCEMQELCEKMHKIRENIANILQNKIKNELNYVGLEKSIFNIKVNVEEKFNEKGKDSIEFLISTNPGQPLKQLTKVVSGGELSRIMLALKNVFINKDDIPSVIFDEIDTGISGRIAQRVGEKMYMISKSHQVFCITHLSQIAVMSDYHYLVSKIIEGNKTYTNVVKLDEKQKQYEIAKMIGGSNVTELTLQNARELIDIATIKKSGQMTVEN
ncbi:DNA repair protein RecN [Haloimpatiens sp. FM7330]|uniref:DNA repair protein RecN n=1 Tax=Haloimpatiens sp. FM7330 TaxID=3298610 RepID=UPI0036393A59